MSHIYATQLNYNVPEKQYNTLLSKLTEEKQEGIQQYVFREDALRSIVADLLIRKSIVTKFQIPNEQIQFETNTYGKPFVKGLPSFHFNVSHSGNWVVCATDNQPIGIDIEEIQPIDFQIAYSFFSRTEIEDIEEKTGNEKLLYFYDLWSLKESYIKMVGKGLSIPLDSFTCRVINDQFFFTSNDGEQSVYLKQYDLDPNYSLSVCQIHPNFSKPVHHISLESLVSDIQNNALWRV